VILIIFDYVDFNEYLLSVDWQAVLVNSYDVNIYWDNFMEVINSALEMFVPVNVSNRKIINHCNVIHIILEMWANGQPDGRPAEHSWRPLFNAAKFGSRST